MGNHAELCPICGEGHLEARLDKNPVEYKGKTATLDMHYSVCSACGSEQSSAAQSRLNKRAMQAFKKSVDGLLTGAEIRELRERWGIKQSEAAEIFGGGPVAFSKYESDDVAQSEAMDKLLRVAAAVPEALAYLAQNANVTLRISCLPDAVLAGTSADWQPLNVTVSESSPKAHLRVVHSSKSTGYEEWRKSA